MNRLEFLKFATVGGLAVLWPKQRNMIPTQLVGYRLELQLGDTEPFYPTAMYAASIEHGYIANSDGTEIMRTPNSFAMLHYVYSGVERKEYYRHGMWVVNEDNNPRFVAFELL